MRQRICLQIVEIGLFFPFLLHFVILKQSKPATLHTLITNRYVRLFKQITRQKKKKKIACKLFSCIFKCFSIDKQTIFSLFIVIINFISSSCIFVALLWIIPFACNLKASFSHMALIRWKNTVRRCTIIFYLLFIVCAVAWNKCTTT